MEMVFGLFGKYLSFSQARKNNVNSFGRKGSKMTRWFYSPAHKIKCTALIPIPTTTFKIFKRLVFAVRDLDETQRLS